MRLVLDDSLPNNFVSYGQIPLPCALLPLDGASQRRRQRNPSYVSPVPTAVARAACMEDLHAEPATPVVNHVSNDVRTVMPNDLRFHFLDSHYCVKRSCISSLSNPHVPSKSSGVWRAVWCATFFRNEKRIW